MLETTIVATAVVALSFACALWAYRQRGETKRLRERAETVERDLQDFNRDLDTMTRRANDQARRIAWLESRVRSGRVLSAVPAAEDAERAEPSTTKRPTITERRHRVLTLSRRGQNPPAIADTLNMTLGEVELIIGMSKVA